LEERFKDLKCDVEDLQVNNIARPGEYESAIRSKERAKEDIAVAKEERPRHVTEANTALREAESEATIILDKANSDARIRTNLAKAEAEAILEQYNKEAEAYESIMGSGGLAFTSEGFISYMGVRVIADAKNPVYIGMNAPAKTTA
jgi:prohibitin 2